MKKADLHVRTTCSMGKLRPEEAVVLAKKKGLAAIAIVDHESVEGIQEAVDAGERYGIEVIPGVELMFEEAQREAHIIGYFIDWRNRALLTEISRSQAARGWRIQRTVEKLQMLGVNITYDEVLGIAGRAAIIGRTHVAELLVQKGVVKDVREAFAKFLAYGKPAYIPRYQLPLSEALRPIFDAGGVPALAHPKFSGGIDLLPEFVKYGLVGLEVYHFSHSSADVKQLKSLAKKYGLVEVGGSDSSPKAGVGDVVVSYKAVEELKGGGRLKKL
ncbi:MAG: PHP domain-containing protein, partial [Candidatus Hadarchaeales archaeon]